MQEVSWINKILAEILREKANLLESGNSNISKDQAINILETIDVAANDERSLSKESARLMLNVSRAQFDNYVREGKLPKGDKEVGFKELSWKKWVIKKFIKDNSNM
jgi:hypothetical protein